MKKIISIICLCGLFWGCGDPNVGGDVTEIYTTSFMMAYQEVGGIEAKVDNNQIWLSPIGTRKWYEITSKGNAEKARFDELAAKHNDTSYNRVVYYIATFPTHSVDVDFLGISITSHADFDAAHPAGTELGDIIHYEGWSYQPFIDNGYVPYTSPEGITSNYYPVSKMVDELTPYDLTLIDRTHMAFLHFMSQPTLAKQHNLTIRMQGDNGKTYTAQTAYLFE